MTSSVPSTATTKGPLTTEEMARVEHAVRAIGAAIHAASGGPVGVRVFADVVDAVLGKSITIGEGTDAVEALMRGQWREVAEQLERLEVVALAAGLRRGDAS